LRLGRFMRRLWRWGNWIIKLYSSWLLAVGSWLPYNASQLPVAKCFYQHQQK
jgi:hypothetical protein